MFRERQFVTENKGERERLKKLVNEMTDKELKLIIYKEGWTIAVALAHLAFWDQYALALLKRWKKEGVYPSHREWDNINDALVPLALSIPPRVAAALAVSSAEAVDREIENSTPEFIKAVEALNEPFRLNRTFNRKTHLDEIDAFLKTKHGTK
ncbi:MAG: maleylpyruvate isomerase N-terminal domain-containing protein [Dehalococcoidales bacterium]